MLFNNNGIHNFYVHFVLCRLPLAAAIYPVDTGRTLNVDKTSRRRPGRLPNVYRDWLSFDISFE